MTPEDKELVERLKDHATAIMGADAVCKEATEAIERLSAEVVEAEKSLGIKQYYVDQLAKELAALRAQIAEAQPVAWIEPDGTLSYSNYCTGNKPLYLHPAADAKDAERLDFITKAESTWHVQWSKRNGGPARYRMIDDGDPWGKWYDSARAAIDDAMKGGA